MNQLITARQYYYEAIAPEERGQNYHRFHQMQLYKDEELGLLQLIADEKERDQEKSWLFDHVPNLSNCALLEENIKELIMRAGDNTQIMKRLSQMFVAKRRDLHPDAYATSTRREYFGDLVFFHVGLSDACFQYTSLFAELAYLKQLHYQLGDDAPLVKHLTQIAASHASKLALAQQKWKIERDYVKLDDETVVEVEKSSIARVAEIAAGLSVQTDKFILGHEIAHHLLGHTGKANDGMRIIESLPTSCQFWQNMPAEHAREFQADALAVCLVTGMVDPQSIAQRQKAQEKFAIQACFGALLTITVLGQFSPDIIIASRSHPSIIDRFEQCRCILMLLTHTEVFNAIEEDILHFQHLLYTSQRCGLGIKTVGQFEE